ncbi:hypothetical protein Tco_0216629 [Tanacetum coccineum]
MALSIADQIALDDALVAPADRLKIGKCNLRLSSDVTSKEATLQVVYDVLKLTPFYKAFQVTADAPEIYMQEFWASAYVHNRSVRFKMNNKKHIIGLEQFRDILQICPKVGNKKFVDPPLEKEILIFLASLGHSGDIRKLTDVNVNKLHQPWRSFAAVINKCLSGTPSYDSLLRLLQAQILWDPPPSLHPTNITPPNTTFPLAFDLQTKSGRDLLLGTQTNKSDYAVALSSILASVDQLSSKFKMQDRMQWIRNERKVSEGISQKEGTSRQKFSPQKSEVSYRINLESEVKTRRDDDADGVIMRYPPRCGTDRGSKRRRSGKEPLLPVPPSEMTPRLHERLLYRRLQDSQSKCLSTQYLLPFLWLADKQAGRRDVYKPQNSLKIGSFRPARTNPEGFFAISHDLRSHYVGFQILKVVMYTVFINFIISTLSTYVVVRQAARTRRSLSSRMTMAGRITDITMDRRPYEEDQFYAFCAHKGSSSLSLLKMTDFAVTKFTEGDFHRLRIQDIEDIAASSRCNGK